MKNRGTSFIELGGAIGELVEVKNVAYGNSFAECGEFLRLLFPDGVLPNQYTDMLAIVRIWDKMKRIATQKDALGENPAVDIGGYALLMLMADNNHRGVPEVRTEELRHALEAVGVRDTVLNYARDLTQSALKGSRT